MNLLYILLSLICLLLTSCSDKKPYPDAMQQAESCIIAHPDSAAFYLSTLESTIKDEPKETQMYYALLVTKAADKQYMTHTSDSLMKVVIHFYENYGDTDKLMESYYYLGAVYRGMKDTPRAIKAFQQAGDAGESSKRNDVLGRIYQKMGVLFAYQSLYDKAMMAARESYVYFEKENDTLGVAFCLRDMARMYNKKHQLDSAEYYYNKAYTKAKLANNELVINSFLSEFGAFYIEHNNLNLAKCILSKVSNIHRYPATLHGLGVIYQNTYQEDSACYYLNMAIQHKNIYAKSKSYKVLSEIEARRNKFHLAFDYAHKSLSLEDSIKKRTQTEAIGKINALYNYRHTEKKNQQLLLENNQKRKQIYLLIIGLLLTMGSIALYINYVQKQKRIALAQRQRLLQLKNQQYKSSKVFIGENKKKIADLEILLQDAEGYRYTLKQQLIMSQKELLEVSNQKIQMEMNEKDLLELSLKRSNIYQSFHQRENGNNVTAMDWTVLQQIIDATYNNFTKKIYTLFPQISEQELQMCYLIKISIPVGGMAQILNRTPSAISNARIRLYKKIHGKEGKADMLDKFILDL